MFAEPKRYLSTYCFAGTLVTWPCVRGGGAKSPTYLYLFPVSAPSVLLWSSLWIHYTVLKPPSLHCLCNTDSLVDIQGLLWPCSFTYLSVMSCCSLSCILHVPAELVHTSSFPTSSCHLLASCQNALPFTSLLFKFCPYSWFSSNASSFRSPSLTFGKQ